LGGLVIGGSGLVDVLQKKIIGSGLWIGPSFCPLWVDRRGDGVWTGKSVDCSGKSIRYHLHRLLERHGILLWIPTGGSVGSGNLEKSKGDRGDPIERTIEWSGEVSEFCPGNRFVVGISHCDPRRSSLFAGTGPGFAEPLLRGWFWDGFTPRSAQVGGRLRILRVIDGFGLDEISGDGVADWHCVDVFACRDRCHPGFLSRSPYLVPFHHAFCPGGGYDLDRIVAYGLFSSAGSPGLSFVYRIDLGLYRGIFDSAHLFVGKLVGQRDVLWRDRARPIL